MITPKNFFIIAALPRSGTAWLATALNLHPDIMAFHEGWVTGGNYTERIKSAAEDYKVVVDCTTNTLPAFDEVPATRIFLDREPVLCAASAITAMKVGQSKWKEAEDLAARWRKRHAPFTIFFDDMTSDKMAAVYRMLLIQFGLSPEIRIHEKLDQLGTMNVQLHGLSDSYYHDKKIQLHP